MIILNLSIELNHRLFAQTTFRHRYVFSMVIHHVLMNLERWRTIQGRFQYTWHIMHYLVILFYLLRKSHIYKLNNYEFQLSRREVSVLIWISTKAFLKSDSFCFSWICVVLNGSFHMISRILNTLSFRCVIKTNKSVDVELMKVISYISIWLFISNLKMTYSKIWFYRMNIIWHFMWNKTNLTFASDNHWDEKIFKLQFHLSCSQRFTLYVHYFF